jgi:hypothetical protein
MEAADNTDTPDAGSIAGAGEAEYARTHRKDPTAFRPGSYHNDGQRDPTHVGPKTGKARRRK